MPRRPTKYQRETDATIASMAKTIGALQARVTRLEKKRRPIGFEPIGVGVARECEEQDEPNYEDDIPE